MYTLFIPFKKITNILDLTYMKRDTNKAAIAETNTKIASNKLKCQLR
jgi:hypothetical protein